MVLSCSEKQTISIIKRKNNRKIMVIFIVWIVEDNSFKTKNKLELREKVCEKKDFRNIMMPSEDTTMLGFNQYQKSDKALSIIYKYLECLIEKIDGCKNNPENSSTTKVIERIASGFSISAISSFKSIENKYDLYKGSDSMKKFC